MKHKIKMKQAKRRTQQRESWAMLSSRQHQQNDASGGVSNEQEYWFIGIDAGVKTGLAVNCNGKLHRVETTNLIGAMERIWRDIDLFKNTGVIIKVFIEDARKRKWVTGGREKLQGVGSVKRDCKIWQEFCEHYNLDYELVAPKNNSTKLSREQFKKITGWTERTSEHARDAAMLVFGRVL